MSSKAESSLEQQGSVEYGGPHYLSFGTHQEPGLIHDSYLDTLQLVVNTEFRFLCCEICQVAIIRSEAKAHTSRKHPNFHFDMNLFNEAVAELEIIDGLPGIPTELRPAIKGLPILDAIACCHCSKVFMSEKKVKEHNTKTHKDIHASSQSRKCKAQRFKDKGTGTYRILWEVLEDTHTTSEKKTIDQVVEEILKDIELDSQTYQAPQDNRMIDSWLSTTNWPNHISGHNIAFLHGLVANPRNNDSDIPLFKQIIGIYFREALDLLPTMDELTLQIINSPDPVKKYVYIL